MIDDAILFSVGLGGIFCDGGDAAITDKHTYCQKNRNVSSSICYFHQYIWKRGLNIPTALAVGLGAHTEAFIW